MCLSGKVLKFSLFPTARQHRYAVCFTVYSVACQRKTSVFVFGAIIQTFPEKKQHDSSEIWPTSNEMV